MARYIINGGKRLSGRVKISGNKNSILPCLAATLLTDQEVTLRNVPQIRDVSVSLQILETLGSEVMQEGHTVVIKTPKIISSELPKDLVSKLRASVLFVGPLLSREGRVKFYHPGGDIIGKRTIEPHLEGFRLMGYNFKQNDREYVGGGSGKKVQDEIFLEEASVTGTENLLLAAARNPQKVTLKNCASEPHVVDLCNLLIQMGVKIGGVGSSTLMVEGKKDLKGADFTVGPDYIELTTYSIAAAITNGELELENCTLDGLEPIILPLSKFGINFERESDCIRVSAKNLEALPKLHTNIWPGFPTDAMSLAIVLATQARGVSLCHDWMYENRMFFVDKLINMGANITIADPHRVLVYGPSKLVARELESPDIRAGMAMVLAALVATGESIIHRCELIERGYENVALNLSSLGADIQRED